MTTSFGVRPVGGSEAGRRIHEAGMKFQREHPAPKAIDHDTVIDLWLKGLTGSAIASRLGIHANHARTIIARARERGDPRVAERRRLPGRPVKTTADEYLATEAKQRGLTVPALRKHIVELVVQDRLVSAVLDR